MYVERNKPLRNPEKIKEIKVKNENKTIRIKKQLYKVSSKKKYTYFQGKKKQILLRQLHCPAQVDASFDASPNVPFSLSSLSHFTFTCPKIIKIKNKINGEVASAKQTSASSIPFICRVLPFSVLSVISQSILGERN